MEQTTYQIDAFWDAEAAVWVATSEDVPGLATEADTIEALSQKLRQIIPDLLLLNHVISADYAGLGWSLRF
jgi:predicted RNase H-like HicB family nuclease